MVTGGQLYVLVVTVMALVALAAAIPVLVGIAREGRERLRMGGPEPPTSEGEDGENIGQNGTDGVHCPHCGTENEAGYDYCEACSRAL
jgi:hypothetical protein